MGHSAFDSSTAMFKALAVVIFAATMMVVPVARSSPDKWYLVETEDGAPEPNPEPETTPCPFEDKSESCPALGNICHDEGISDLCGKTCKCDKGSGPSWNRKPFYSKLIFQSCKHVNLVLAK